MPLSVSLPGAARLELTGTSPNSYFAYSSAKAQCASYHMLV